MKLYTEEAINHIISNKIVIRGIVIRWNDKFNKGFIYNKRLGKDIFFSRDSLFSATNGRKVRASSKVEFILTRNRYCNDSFYAVDVKVFSHVCSDKEKLLLPNGIAVRNVSVYRYGIHNMTIKILKEMNIPYSKLLEEGYTKEDFDYIYIRTGKNEYRIFKSSCPVHGDGKVDNLKDYLKFLDNKILKVNRELSVA